MQSNGKTARKNDCTKDSTPSQNSPLYKIPCRVTAPPFSDNEDTPPLFITVHAGTPEEAILLWHDAWKDCSSWGFPLAEKILRPSSFILSWWSASGSREARTRPTQSVRVVLLTLSNTVQNAIIGEDKSVLGGIIGRHFPAGHQLSRRSLPIRSQETRPVGRSRADV